jgi:3-phosphoshikimate 1-carboxyvinyltransferase
VGVTLPLEICGKLKAATFTLPGDVSSQYISGLLLALPLLQGDSRICLSSPLQSAPYVQMTLAVLGDFGVEIQPEKGGWLVPGGQTYRSPKTYRVEGDWSQAAVWLAANQLGSAIELDGLTPTSTQGDRVAAELLDHIFSGDCELDMHDCPDLVPVLAAAAACAPGMTHFTQAGRLRLKESDRLASTQAALAALGADIQVTYDGLLIRGQKQLQGGESTSFGDHRICMALVAASLKCEHPVLIRSAEVARKSYPSLYTDYVFLGGSVKEL